MHHNSGSEARLENPPAIDAATVVEHVTQLLNNPLAPELAPELEAVPGLASIHHYIVELRKQLGGYAKGDFSGDLELRGAVAGMVKSLQANMRHIIWQMERIKGGDFTQRLDFMGEFTQAFNNMVTQLDDALTALHQRENELVSITRELQQEVEKRGAALSALKKSEQNFRYLAGHDHLTNLLNRRSFLAQAEVELARNTILDHATAIAVMDVDHFKRFNDTYGHLNGDLALRHIADIGFSTLRDNDITGRLGGEEFVFLFSKAEIRRGYQAAERIRALIEANPVFVEGCAVPVTASFGVVSIPPNTGASGDVNLLERAMELADKAMYQAKSEGRNQVRTADFLL